MKLKHLLTAVLAVALPLATPALASVVSTTGTYGLGLSDARTGTSLLTGLRFDGRSSYVTRVNEAGEDVGSVVVREREESLGGGYHQLNISLVNPHRTGSGDADLFPWLEGEDQTGDRTVGLHFGFDALDLLGNFRLESLFVRMFSAGEELRAVNLLDLFPGRFSNTQPWNGGLFDDGSVVFIENGRGQGIDRVDWEFNIVDMPNQVPEPGPLALAGIALLAFGWASRRGSVGKGTELSLP